MPLLTSSYNTNTNFKMKFSERNGIVKAKESIQIDYMDDDLRNGLWNSFQMFYLDQIDAEWINHTEYYDFFRSLWHNFYKEPLDTLDNWYESTRQVVKKSFFSASWYEVYDFIEYIANVESPTDNDIFREYCNKILERELSGYRFVHKSLAPISNKIEIDEIDQAINHSTNNYLDGVRIHLESALKMLSDREYPDYRNSIKESISAIESIAKVISNNSKDSLGAALDKIKGKIKLHPSLEKGFKQIYGYTSDSDGIRHALSEESSCDFDDAKYMLVSSSAFVNYLISKSNKAKIISNK